MKNTGGSRWGGAITAAQFIQRFVADKTPWAHLDIAGTGMDSRSNDINKSWGSGWGVRLLDRLGGRSLRDVILWRQKMVSPMAGLPQATKVLREAIAKVEALPEADQDRIARELIDYLDKLKALRAEVQIGIRQLDAGEGKELDIEDVIRQAREEYGRDA